MAKKILLAESEIPNKWFNVVPSIPNGLEPPLNPATGQPAEPESLGRIFPGPLLEQEMSPEEWISIPDEVLEILTMWRPTPLVRADRLEKAIGAKARIYFKNESISPAGSHKVNSSVPQAFFNKQVGINKLTTETGAGQWGSALSFACSLLELECLIYMVKCSYEQKPFRRSMIHSWGAEVLPSPSDTTESGRAVLAEDPECPGSLGIAISEAVEIAATRDDTNYTLGSVLNHVLLHQTIIGLEAKKQLDKAGEQLPAAIIGCCGGGSNFAGIAAPFIPERLSGKQIKFIGVEPAACPTMTRGHYAYDFGDSAGQTPLLKMHSLGSKFVPPGIHAGGLRYHGMAPIISALIRDEIVTPVSYHQRSCFEAALTFARSEGIVPAPETSHAIMAVIEEAKKDENQNKVILFNFSGHGHFDMTAYDKYLSQEMQDYDLPDQTLEEAAKDLPSFGFEDK